MKRSLFLILLSAAFMAAPSVYSSAQSICKLKPTMTVLLYPDGQEESNGITEPEWNDETGRIGNISDSARVDIYLPKKCNGQMIVVCPGGGYRYVSALKEGIHVADWMNARGIAVAVVKHRMPEGHWEVPLIDVQNTFRYCRAHAAEWGISQIGVMGFSAGGHLAACVSNHYVDAVTRPDFSILIYPVTSFDYKVYRSGTRPALIGKDEVWVGKEDKLNELVDYYSMEKRVGPETPQTFISHCTNDKTLVDNSLVYYKSLITHKVPVEMHIWKSGGHGWGFSSEKNVGKGKDKLSAHRKEFYTVLSRWLENIR